MKEQDRVGLGPSVPGMESVEFLSLGRRESHLVLPVIFQHPAILPADCLFAESSNVLDIGIFVPDYQVYRFLVLLVYRGRLSPQLTAGHNGPPEARGILANERRHSLPSCFRGQFKSLLSESQNGGVARR